MNKDEAIQAYVRGDLSERKLAKALGMSRAFMWRAKRLSEVPEDLFEEWLDERGRMIDAGEKPPGVMQLINQWRQQLGQKTFASGGQVCPHCGHSFVARARATDSED
jgi:hypothetical protein